MTRLARPYVILLRPSGYDPDAKILLVAIIPRQNEHFSTCIKKTNSKVKPFARMMPAMMPCSRS
ncbi:MAG: hypothetical protein H8M99_12010 [Gloeobacteraceae cyanobacterium ES-bin-144]|nr:hypothetical protein [Verrucomicrobiales bacterium]